MKLNKLNVGQIKFWCYLLIAIAVFAKFIQITMFGFDAAFDLSYLYSEPDAFLLGVAAPFANGVLFLLLAKWLPCSRRELLIFSIAGAALVAIIYGFNDGGYRIFTVIYVFITPLTWFLMLKGGCLFVGSKIKNTPLPVWVPVFVLIGVAFYSLGFLTTIFVKTTGIIYPLTYDLYLHKLEMAFGGFANSIAIYNYNSNDFVKGVSQSTYVLLSLIFLPPLAWLYRENKAGSVNAWRLLILPFLLGGICYAWLPASGPHYIYYDNFPFGVMPPKDVNAEMVALASVPRNAMPSFHVSGAIWIMMACAAFRRKWALGLSVLFTLATVWATFATGEHYTIDVVVALSFAPAMGLWLMQTPRWRVAPLWQKNLQRASLLTFLLWMALLRLVPDWLLAHLLFVQGLAFWSLLAGLILLIIHVVGVWNDDDTRQLNDKQVVSGLFYKSFTPPQFLPAQLNGKRWLVFIFFFSGLAGLVYEVVYAKALGVTFGGTALAANTVLMTYMGGMALGAWIGGIIAAKAKRPLFLYAVFEVAIGFYAVLTPTLFNAIQKFYVYISLDVAPDASSLTAFRIGLGVIILAFPTVLMGATLPLIFKCLKNLNISTSEAIAPLYGANVLGAAFGALIGGYVILPAVGRDGGTYIAALISLMIGLYVIEKLKAPETQLLEKPQQENGTVRADEVVANNALLPLQSKAALLVLLIGGAVTLALEVVFMHLLAVVAGNSVYAFGLMLATFLLGLGLGSTVGEHLIRKNDRAKITVWSQIGIALSILLTSFLWDGIANYMGSFGYLQQYGVHLSFSARELIRGLVCALAMMPPAFFIGMSYPATMGLAADGVAVSRFKNESARGIGFASAVNTLGNISGVLLAAFWLLPLWGSRDTLLMLACLAIALAILVIFTLEKGGVLKKWFPVVASAAALAFFPSHWNFEALSSGGNVYFYPQNWGKVIAHTESVEGGLTTVAQSSPAEGGHLTLLTNGKFQGNNAEGGEMLAQESFALIPLLHTEKRGNALAIGYGTGMTTRALAEQGFSHLDVAETSRDIVFVADKYFKNINEHISQSKKVSMHYTDGRNYLLTQSKKYDLISLEISSIWFAGAANLYNKEFYALANSRLTDGGVLQQWVQLHHMRPIDFFYIVNTVRSEFKYVWLYFSGGQGIIVASNSADSLNNKSAMHKLQEVKPISSLKVDSLPKTLVADYLDVDNFLNKYDPSHKFFISTDKNLYLEYATPKGNALNENTVPILIDMLKGNLKIQGKEAVHAE